ncbi:carbohydrate ABC transporter permease [Jiangella alkaliphila]|uniref:Multiple sugar transport system permease protein n=1 Tax=Jiangella alkaliphila TaxID=419479 RepID=A0A1H2LIU3_9ACTN|nr:sugar ABC transporter permease [Jiangella alkaliphila]SDU80734.1 multiple sugar transport system permease protein [Jiangella alkaliphila]
MTTATVTRPTEEQAAQQGRAARSRRWRAGGRRELIGLLFLLPAILIFGMFAWWPIVRGLIISFQRTDLMGTSEWVGLANFEALFADPLLGTAVMNTLLFVGLGVLIGFPAPLILASVLSTVRRYGGVYRFLVYLPVVIPPVVSVLLWKWFYDPGAGLFNELLGTVGLGPYPWLESPDTAMLSLVLESTWAGMGGTVLIYLAAMVGIPQELYEAAEIDGANLWQRIWHVMLPQLRTVIALLLLWQLINTVQVFTEPYVFTGGGPQNATTTVLLLIFRYGFQQGNYGQAAALAFLLALSLAVLSAVYLRATRSWSKS